MSANVATQNVATEKTPPRPRAAKSAGGAKLGQTADAAAKRMAAAILEVLAGARTPLDAATALAVSLPRYYQLESRALEGLVSVHPPGHLRATLPPVAARDSGRRPERG